MEDYDENPTIRLYGEPEKPPVEGNPFTIRTEVGDNTYEQVKNPNYVNPKPSDEELSMFEEWKGIEGNIKAQLGYFEPDEIPSKISSDWEAEYQKRTGLRWGLMESYATKQERQDQKAFMVNRASMYKNQLSSIKSDLSAARTMWKSDRMRKLKEDQLRLKKQQEIEGNPILSLYTKAKAGDMEAWNQLHQMQRKGEELQELKEKYKAAKEAAKPKKLSEYDRYYSVEMKKDFTRQYKELLESEKYLNRMKPKAGASKDEIEEFNVKSREHNERVSIYESATKKFQKWLKGFDGTPNEVEESDDGNFDRKMARAYLDKYGNLDDAYEAAVRDGHKPPKPRTKK